MSKKSAIHFTEDTLILHFKVTCLYSRMIVAIVFMHFIDLCNTLMLSSIKSPASSRYETCLSDTVCS